MAMVEKQLLSKHIMTTSEFPCKTLVLMAQQVELTPEDVHLIDIDEVNTFVTKKRLLDHLNGRMLLQLALEQWGEIHIDYLDIQRSQYRQPYLRYVPGVWKNQPLPSCSLSHSEGFVFVALCEPQWSIGVDAEPLSRRLSDRTFDMIASGDELINLRAEPDTALRLWTSKEAVQKSMGLGMHLNPRKIVIPIENNMTHFSIGKTKIQLEYLQFCDFHISIALSPQIKRFKTAEEVLLDQTREAMQQGDWSVGCKTTRKGA